MLDIIFKIEEEESTYLFDITVSSGCFKNTAGFSLSEDDYKYFVHYLNSSGDHEINGDVSNGHESLEIKGGLVSVSGAHYMGNMSPSFELTLSRDLYKMKIAEFEKSRAC